MQTRGRVPTNTPQLTWKPSARNVKIPHLGTTICGVAGAVCGSDLRGVTAVVVFVAEARRGVAPADGGAADVRADAEGSTSLSWPPLPGVGRGAAARIGVAAKDERQ